MRPDEIIEILRKGEGPRVEFKREFPDQAHAIAKEMVALANSGGGILLMGVEDDGTPKGISDHRKAEERLSNIARSCTPIVQAEIDTFQLSKSIFLVYARVAPASTLTLYQAKTYKRTGSLTHEATGEEVTRIVLKMQGLPQQSPNKARPARTKGKKVSVNPGGLARIPAMFERGIIKTGDTLTIRQHDKSEATIVDQRNVRYEGQILSYNKWGEKIVGRPGVNIYREAVLNGKTLDELRTKAT